MHFTRSIQRFGLVVASLPMLLGAPAVTSAQTAAGAAIPELSPGANGLVISGTVRAAFDTRLTTPGLGADIPSQSGGIFPTADASITYVVRNPSRDFLVWAGSGGQYYSQLEQPLAYDHRGGATAIFRPGPRTTYDLIYSSSYASYFTLAGIGAGFDGFPSGGQAVLGPVQPAFQQRVSTLSGWRHTGRFGTSRRLSTRTTLAAYGDVAGSDYAGRNMLSFGGGAELTRQMSARVGILGRYTLLQGASGGQSIGMTHTPEFGINYAGRAYAVQATGGAAFTGISGARLTNATGGVRVARTLGRSWTGDFGYRRGVQLSFVLSQFVANDNLDANLSRTFGRQIEWRVSAQHSTGRLGQAFEQRVKSTSAGTGVSIPFNRNLGAVVEYAHFLYSMDESLARSLGLPGDVERDVVMVGFAWRIIPRP